MRKIWTILFSFLLLASVTYAGDLRGKKDAGVAKLKSSTQTSPSNPKLPVGSSFLQRAIELFSPKDPKEPPSRRGIRKTDGQADCPCWNPICRIWPEENCEEEGGR